MEMLLTLTGGWLLLSAVMAAAFVIVSRGARAGVARRAPHLQSRRRR